MRTFCFGHRAGLAIALLLLVRTSAAPVSQGAGVGTIEGVVHLAAQPPRNRPIRMMADPACAQIHSGKQVIQETVLRAPDGGLANVFLHLRGAFPQSGAPAAPITIDQRGCLYIPRVQGARVGQVLQVKNHDETLHNIRSHSTVNPFNVSQPKAGMTFNFRLRSDDVMLHVRCDVHSWMTGYVGVVTHPFFAVTNARGAFTVPNVPPGKHTIQAWHEAYGPLTREVNVAAGATTKVSFEYRGDEKASPPAGFASQVLTLPAHASSVHLLRDWADDR
jgi:hypothetical protein